MVANKSHHSHASTICKMINDAAKVRGTGIAKRDPAYVIKKMDEGQAVISLHQQQVTGFCYIESWEGKKYVANSGLIVHPEHRKTGLAKALKTAAFHLSKKLYPDAKLFGITTSMAVMKINLSLGYSPAAFEELTQEEAFWQGCQTCVNYDVLQRTNRTLCLCTGMVCDLKQINEKNSSGETTVALPEASSNVKANT